MIVLAVEGEHTESQYFKPLRNGTLDIEILATEGNDSAPQHIESRMDAFLATNKGLESGDFWLVMDVDRWHQLGEVCQRAQDKGYKTAVSNPCFELWLWLHLANASTTMNTCSKLETALRSYLGSYNKSNLQIDQFHPHIENAMKRARGLSGNQTHPIPSFPGTHIPLLMERILGSPVT
ncbi:MAG: RloB family protein [Armatimonas sp.]